MPSTEELLSANALFNGAVDPFFEGVKINIKYQNRDCIDCFRYYEPIEKTFVLYDCILA